jgi:hypothetical protein
MPNPILFFEYGYNIIFEPEYTAVLNYAIANGITIPKRDQNVKNNKKIKQLKDLGAWTEFDLFYYFKQSTGLSEFCKINWVNPSLYFLTQPVPAQTPIFEPNAGFKGNFADSKFFNTGYTPSLNAVNTVLNDMSIMYKSYDEVLGCVCGTRNGSGNNFVVRKTDGSGTSITQLATTTGSGGISGFNDNSHIIHTKNGLVHNRYVDGAFSTSVSYSSTTLSSFPLSLFGWNLAGTTSSFFTGGIEYFALGSGFFDTIPNQMYNIMNS